MHVIGFGGCGWAFHGNHRERTEFGQHEKQAREKVSLQPAFVAIGGPIVERGGSSGFFLDFRGVGRIRLRRLLFAMQESDCVSHTGNQSARGKPVARTLNCGPLLTSKSSVSPYVS